jgi:preprotein translocase subunit SecA
MYERIMVPITDGRHMYNIGCNLEEAYNTECKSVVKEFEKQMLLHIIDDAWKENLRELDELRHSVQNASYEQKDPLLIFKLESVKLFDSMVATMNNRTVSILTRAAIPQLVQEGVQQAAPEEHTDRRQYTESKAGSQPQEQQLVDEGQRAAAQHDTRAQQPRNPVIKDKLPGRNDPCPCGSGKKFKNCHGKGLV